MNLSEAIAVEVGRTIEYGKKIMPFNKMKSFICNNWI